MAKRKQKPKAIPGQTVDTLAADLAVDVDQLCKSLVVMRARLRKRSTRVVDPCAAELSVKNDADAIWQAAFEITLAAGEIAMAANMELMNCRMRNP